jgi:hypothetical protein
VAVSCAKDSRFVPGEWEEEALWLPEFDPHDLATQKKRDAETAKQGHDHPCHAHAFGRGA